MNVMITGAGKGIGKATAMLLASQGYNLAICSRTKEDLVEIQQQCEKQFPKVKVFDAVCDVTDEKDVKRFCADALKALGSIDVLVNNAGTYVGGQLINQSNEDFDFMMQTNLNSMIYFCKAIVPQMKSKPSSLVINIGSMAGIAAYENGGAYSISKHAVHGFTMNLREELKKDKIKITHIAPGAVRTSSWDGTNLPDSRFIPAADIASIISLMEITGKIRNIGAGMWINA